MLMESGFGMNKTRKKKYYKGKLSRKKRIIKGVIKKKRGNNQNRKTKMKRKTIKKKIMKENRRINHVEMITKDQIQNEPVPNEEKNIHEETVTGNEQMTITNPMTSVDESDRQEEIIAPSASIQLNPTESMKLMQKFEDEQFQTTFNELLKENHTEKLVELLTKAGIVVNLIYKK
jgi:hypothetical protein